MQTLTVNFGHFLGFAWNVNNVTKYYVFRVLPFGLATAGHIFTKLVRVLIKYWRSNAIQILCYLDDGFGAEKSFDLALKNSTFVKKKQIDKN